MKYTVRAVKYGYVEVEAKDICQAYQIAKCMDSTDFNWNGRISILDADEDTSNNDYRFSGGM